MDKQRKYAFYPLRLDNPKLEELIPFLQDALEKEEKGEWSKLRLKIEDDSGTVELAGYRLETDAECQERESQERERAEARLTQSREANERAQYETLKKKYG